MLTPVDPGPAVVACSSCRRPGSRASGEPRDGARLVAGLDRVQASDPAYRDIAIQSMPCLFACGDGCTVHLRAPGKMGYVLGRFEPDEDAARAILDYALNHAASAEGQVPYALWPQGVKGHFLVRVPPAGYVAT